MTGREQNQIKNILAGDVRTIARTLTLVENGAQSRVTPLLRKLFRHTGKSFVVGITGSPGSGKSTLVDQLARCYRASRQKVGILAVDPSSPFSGGALLGDRIRMQSLATDPDIFIRSVATRGKMGGLAAAVHSELLVLDAAGYRVLLVETVGAGQDEVDVARAAHVTLLILVPGMGDDIQTVKAGIMEIADIFVINKADREGALRTEQELKAFLSISSRPDGWMAPVIKTVATRGEGIDELKDAIQAYRSFLKDSPAEKARAIWRHRERLLEMLKDRFHGLVKERISEQELQQYAEQIMTRELDPYTIVDRLLKKVGVEGPHG